jgi:hypothetical protein
VEGIIEPLRRRSGAIDPRKPTLEDALIELGLALLALLAFTIVAFGAQTRLLSPVLAFGVEAFGGRGRLLLFVVLVGFALLSWRALRNRNREGWPSPGLRPGSWLCRMQPPELLLAGTFLALVLVLSARGGRLEVDGPLLFVQLRSAVIDHDLDLTNEFAEFVPERYQYWADEGRQLGRTPNPTVEPGTAILWAPFFLLAHAFILIARLWGAPFVADGYGAPYVNAVCLGSLVWAFVAVIVAYRIARRFFAPLLCALCAAAAWLATPLVWYSAFEPGMSHATASAAVSAFVWLWLRVRDDPSRRRRWLLLALAGGALVSMQRYDAYFLLCPLITALGLLWRTPRPQLILNRRALVATAGIALLTLGLTLVPLIYTNLSSRHASLLGESHLIAFTFKNWAHPRVGELLFSSRNGLLSWTPVAYLGALGLVLLARRDRGLAASLLLTLAFGVYLLAASYSWSGAWSFGSRRLTEAFALFVLGLCTVATSLMARPAVLGVLSLGGLAIWNLLLAEQVRRREIPRDDTFAFSEAAARATRRAYQSVGHLPAAPAPWIFAWTYGVSPDRFDLVFGREPTARVNIAMGTPADEPFLGRGWSYPESGPDGKPFRWSDGSESTLLLSLADPREYRLAFRGEPSRHPAGLPQTVAVKVNGRAVRAWTLAEGAQSQTMEIGAASWRAGLNEVRFVYGWTVEAGTDRRQIAWRVERVVLYPAGESE